MKLAISTQAAMDFDEIYQYGYAKFGEIQAEGYAESLENCFQSIRQNPEIGRIDTRVKPAIRRHEHKNHVICYDKYSDKIVIVRILHKSMNFFDKFSR